MNKKLIIHNNNNNKALVQDTLAQVWVYLEVHLVQFKKMLLMLQVKLKKMLNM